MNIGAIIGFGLAAAILVGCDDRSSRSSDSTSAPSKTPAADNTGRNKVDRDSSTKTPLDQSNTDADTKIAAEIRRAVMDDSSLSTNAHNCKIICEKGVVTLRGAVNSDAEKARIAGIARGIVGVTKVEDQIEVAPK